MTKRKIHSGRIQLGDAVIKEELKKFYDAGKRPCSVCQKEITWKFNGHKLGRKVFVDDQGREWHGVTCTECYNKGQMVRYNKRKNPEG